MLKKSVVFKRNQVKLPRLNYKNVFFYVLFLCGFIIGVLTVSKMNSDANEILKHFFTSYLIENSNKDFLDFFIESVLIIAAIPFLTFLFGLCVFGIPCIISAPAFVGAISGVLIGFLYLNFGLKGLGFCALIIIPIIAITVATLIKCCEEAINMSVEIIAITGGFQTSNKRNELKEYCMKFIVLLLPLILSSILYIGCFNLFGGLFSFI